jgi:hypothetical protein
LSPKGLGVSGIPGKLQADFTFQGILADYRRNIHEYGSVQISDLDKVEKRLPFPRLRDGLNVVKPVSGHRSRTDSGTPPKLKSEP